MSNMKKNLDRWIKNIEEISNGVWKVTLTHKLGFSIEKNIKTTHNNI